MIIVITLVIAFTYLGLWSMLAAGSWADDAAEKMREEKRDGTI